MTTLIGWDTETRLISDNEPLPRTIVHSFHGDGIVKGMGYYVGDRTTLDKSARLLWVFLQLAKAGKVIIVAHNAAFDICSTIETWPQLTQLFFELLDKGSILCTQLGVRLRRLATIGDATRRNTSLAACADTFLGETVAKGEDTWRLRYGELERVSLKQWPAAAIKYAADDARLVHNLAQKIWPMPADTAAQTRYSVAFRYIEAAGLRVDAGLLQQERRIAEVKLDTYRRQAVAAGYIRAEKHTKDLAKIREAIEDGCDRLGIAPPLTKSGAVSYGAEALELLPSDHPARAVVGVAQQEKIISTYLDHYSRAAQQGIPVRPQIDILKNTGRTSMSKPNLQNIPRSGKLREIFVPSEGYVYANADLDSAEMRSLGQACLDTVGYSALAKLFQKNPQADAHIALAASMQGITLWETKQLFDRKDPVILDARQRAKAGNFGFAGGMGAEKFVSAQQKMGAVYTVAQAAELRDQYLRKWDEVPRYFSWVQRQLDAGGEITLEVSRRTRAGCGFCDGANTGFQGRTADVAKLWCYMIVRESLVDETSPLHGSRLVHFVHDEVILESPENKAHDAAMRTSELAAIAGSYHLPDVPTISTPCLMKRWYKKASPLYDDKGRLIPWEPTC